MKKVLVLLLILSFPIIVYGQTDDSIHERLGKIEEEMISCNFARIPHAVHGDEWLLLGGLGDELPQI